MRTHKGWGRNQSLCLEVCSNGGVEVGFLTHPLNSFSSRDLPSQDSIIKLQEEQEKTGLKLGLDVVTGDTMSPEAEGVWDNTCVKRQSIHLSTVLATQLLLVDEIMKAGKKMGKESMRASEDEP